MRQSWKDSIIAGPGNVFLAGLVVVLAACGPDRSLTIRSGGPDLSNGLWKLTSSDWRLAGDGRRLRLFHSSQGEKGKISPPLISFRLEGSFVEARRVQVETKYSMASFEFEEDPRVICSRQSVEKIVAVNKGEGHFAIAGTLRGDNCPSVQYELKLIPVSTDEVRLELDLTGGESGGNMKLNQVFLRYDSDAEEGFFGFGEQFSHFNLKGHKPYIFSEEQGIGRGDQPITFGANLMEGAGGNEYSTYAPMAVYLTSRGRAAYFANTGRGHFDLRADDHVEVMFQDKNLRASFYQAGDPMKLVEKITEKTGRMAPLPDWAYGTWLGLQGGREKVEKIVSEAKEAGNPVTALWIQDWVGRRKTNFGSQLWWRWLADEKSYPAIREMITNLNKQGVQVLGYINPFLADKGPMFEEARAKGYLVKNKQGKPYKIRTVGFPAYIIDLTNPECVAWIKNIIKKNMIGLGLRGWMADFGEWLPTDAVLHSGVSAWQYHNLYPQEWARVNREAIREAGLEGQVVFFTRAGYNESPRYSTLFWEGDQMVSWGEHDGLPSALTGMLSGGLSGISLNHSDIGGYTTINNSLKNYHRSQELFLRWAELSVFTPVFRTHEGNRPEKNHQPYSAQQTVKDFARYGKMHYLLKDYLKELAQEAAARGWPVVRPVYLHYPDQAVTHNMRKQFLLGSDLLVAPVLEEGEDTVQVWFPPGKWVSLWDQKPRTGPGWKEEAAPLGKPAAFVKQGSAWQARFLNGFAGLK